MLKRTLRIKNHRVTSFIVLVLCFFVGYFILPISFDFQSAFACWDVSNCTTIGQTIDQGCAANGCPSGTRRVCTCNRENPVDGRECQPIKVWGCRCVSDPSCGGTPPGPPGPPAPVPPPTTCPGARQPSPVDLVAPPNRRTIGNNSVNLRWSTSGEYGVGCPTQDNRKWITMIPWPTSNCPANLRNYPITFEGRGRVWINFTNNRRFDNLDWNQWYCWQVTKSNGSASSGTKARSQIWAFRTPAPPAVSTPTLDGGSFVSSTIDNCSVGDQVSGRLTGTANDANINNPVGYELNVSYTPPGVTDIAEVRFAIVSNDYLATFPNTGRVSDGDNDLLYLEALEPNLHDPTNQRNLGMRVTNLGSSPTYSIINSNSAPHFGSGVTSGNLNAGSGIARLRDIGSQTTVVSGSNSYTVRFTTEFNPVFANGDYTLYASVLSDNGSGGLISHSPQADRGSYDGDLIYQEVDSWRIDMTPPSASIQDPVFVSGTDFSVRWEVSDNNSVDEVRSYCYFASPATATIRDITSGNDIAFDGNSKAYPDPGNCFVITPGVHNRNYQVTSGALSEDMVLGLYARDNACNVTNNNSTGVVPNPWFMGLNQTLSAAGGLVDVEIPNTSVNLADIGLTLAGRDYLGTFEVISGNTNLPTPLNKTSQSGVYVTGYNNKNVAPVDLGYSSWYELATASLDQNVTVANSGLSTISSNLSGAYGAAAGSSYYVRHTGNLSIDSGVICNLRAIIIVEGNLTIDPNFTRNGSNACIFIVQGDVTITAGQHASNGLTTADNARHDIVEAMFIVNGAFTTSPDPAPTGPVNDALFLRGSVFAENVNLQRILNPNQSASQPAEVIMFDPRHVFHFRNALKVSEFSLREF